MGFGRQQRGPKRGPDLTIDLPVGLDDLYNGKEVEVAVRKRVVCPRCRGSGAKNADDVETCTVCKGRGITITQHQLGPGFVQQVQQTCNKCGGKGKIAKSKCPFCKAKKVVTGEDSLMVSVERGMADGEEITYEGASDESPDEAAGNLIFKIATMPHPLFSREGNDLHYKLTITLQEALLGFTTEIKHLDEHMVPLSSESITIPGQVIKVDGEGMPHREVPSEKGDLFVHVTVAFPTKLDAAQKEHLKQALENAWWPQA